MQPVKLIKALSIALLLSCGMQSYAMDEVGKARREKALKKKQQREASWAAMSDAEKASYEEKKSQLQAVAPVASAVGATQEESPSKEAAKAMLEMMRKQEAEKIEEIRRKLRESVSEIMEAEKAAAMIEDSPQKQAAKEYLEKRRAKMAAMTAQEKANYEQTRSQLRAKTQEYLANEKHQAELDKQVELSKEAAAAAQEVAPAVTAAGAPQVGTRGKSTKEKMAEFKAKQSKARAEQAARDAEKAAKVAAAQQEEVADILADDELQEPEPVQQESENPRLIALRAKRAAAIAAQAPESAQQEQETDNPKLIALREERKKHLSHMDRELQKYSKKKNKIDAEKEADQKPAEEVVVSPVAPVVRKNKRLEALMAVAASQALPEVIEFELGSEIESAIEQQESAAQADKTKGMEELARYDAAAQVLVADSAAHKRAPTARMLALREQQAAFERSPEEQKELDRQAKKVAAAREAKLARPLLGSEVEAVYTTDEYKLIEGGWILRTDASLPYKNESMLFDNLASDNQDYLCNARATRHLNCMINHVSAGIVQTLRAHGILDIETKKRIFTIDGINAILALQDPRTEKISNLFNLLAVRIAEGKKPRLQPDEGAMRFLQTSVKAISQLQLLKVRMQTLQDNPRIRETKALDRLVHSMRLAPDKGEISDEEYNDDYIYERTKKAIQ